MCPVGTEPGSNLLELRPAAGGAGFGVPLPVVPVSLSPAGWLVPAKALYELSQAGCCVSRGVLPSFHPALPHLHN